MILSRLGFLLAMSAALLVELFSVGASAGNCRRNRRRSW